MYKKWTQQEENFLEMNINKMSDREIARELGRTKKAIMEKRAKMGIGRHAKSKRVYTLDSFLRRIYGDE